MVKPIKIVLYAHTLDGRIAALWLRPLDSVWTLKMAIEAALGVPASVQRTIIARRECVDVATLEECGALDQCTVHVVPMSAVPTRVFPCGSVCCVCLAAKPTVMCIPCGHLCLCEGCASLHEDWRNATCPMCRGRAQCRQTSF
jgi:hypothetical protein